MARHRTVMLGIALAMGAPVSCGGETSSTANDGEGCPPVDIGLCDPARDTGGTGGGAGADADGQGNGAKTGAYCDSHPDEYGCTRDIGNCYPSDHSCYLASGVGDECMAQRDNARGATDRLQFRRTWVRETAPAQFAIDAIYDINRLGSGLGDAACHDYGTSGFIELLDITLSDDGDVGNDSMRVGYSPRVGADEIDLVRTNGLCMIEDTFSDGITALPADQMSPASGYPEGLPAPMPMPWSVRPARLRRVTEDFTLPADRDALLASASTGPGVDGYFHFDDATGVIHSYVVQGWIVLYLFDSYVTLPIREVETRYQLNDADDRSCIGSFRGGDLDLSSYCDSELPANPQWGCPGDVECQTGEGPAHSQGYFLITELEQAEPPSSGQTYCFMLFAQEDCCWGDDTTCRGNFAWDPSSGVLPQGDWCAATNSPATADCHDALRSETWAAFQAFNVTDGTCGF